MASSSNSSSPNTSQFSKLTNDNYLLWVRPIKSHLNGAELWGYVDGSIPEPPSTITIPASGDTPATIAPNPKHKEWFIQDQKIVSLLTTALTDKIARLTVGFETSKGIWDCLARHFNQRSVASATSLKLQLYDLQKGSQSVDDYLQHAKTIADSLASINQHVSDADLVVATLHVLGPDYLMLSTALAQASSLPAFSDLRARILAFDAQQQNRPSDLSFGTAIALYNQGPSQDSNHSSNQYRGSNHGQSWSNSRRDGRRPQSGGRGNRGKRNGFRPSSSSQNPPYQSTAPPPFSSPAWAARPPWTQGLLGPAPQWCPNCHTNHHGLAQCPHRYLWAFHCCSLCWCPFFR